jgi:hypothetical protein
MATTLGERPSPLTNTMRRISWGAIIAGTMLVVVLQIMLGLLGVAIGLTVIDPAANDTPSAFALASGSGIWALVMVLLSTFAGGWTAAWLAGSPSNINGALHGLVTWATSTLLAVWLLTSGATAVLSGALGAFSSAVQGVSQAVQTVVPDSLSALPGDLERDARQLLERGAEQAQDTAQQAGQQGQQAAQQAQQATGEEDFLAAAQEIVAGVQEGATPEQRQAAVQLTSQRAGISEEEANQRLDQFQTSYNEAIAQAEQAAQGAADALAGTAFTTFVVLLLGLLAGGAGGWLGRPPHPLAEAY